MSQRALRGLRPRPSSTISVLHALLQIALLYPCATCACTSDPAPRAPTLEHSEDETAACEATPCDSGNSDTPPSSSADPDGDAGGAAHPPAEPEDPRTAPPEPSDAGAGVEAPGDAGAAPTSAPEPRGAVIDLAAGDYHTCVVVADGSVKCWGLNDYGQLGLGDTRLRGRSADEMGLALPAVDLGAGQRATAVAAGTDHTCALLASGSVKCWGGNERGQLGQGDTLSRGTGAADDPGLGDSLPPVDLGAGRTAVAISAGERHSCALLDDGSVKCWGDSFEGQLGQGSISDRGAGAPDDPGMGDALLPIDLGASARAVAIATGACHSCALLDDGAVKCWGCNDFGQLGQGDTLSRGTGLSDDRGMGALLPPVSALPPGADPALAAPLRAVAIGAGYGHTCALLVDGAVSCWGRNRYGQLGYDGRDRLRPIAAVAGGVERVALGAALALDIVGSKGHQSCARFDDGQAKCWGNNRYGQLGQGDTVDRGTGADPGLGEALAPIPLGGEFRVARVASGLLHTCFVSARGELKCCGSNAAGQLGYGDRFDRCSGAPELPMGDALPLVPYR